jgi:hypothetical protein
LTKERDLITDGIAQVQRLLEKDGIRPENITLKGSELGATVATKVARHFHKRDQKINVFNVSGFSTVTNKYVGKIRQLGANSNTGHQETIGGKILGWFAKPFIKLFLVLSQWEMDAASAYNELPDTHKEYMVVRSSKNTRKNDSHVKDNSVITHYASLHAALKEERTKKKAELDELASSLRNANTQILIKNNLDQAQKNIAEARAHLRERKMQTAFSNDEGHGAPMDTLRDRYKGNTADHFFHQFFTRGQNDQHQKTAASTTKLSGKQARR